MSGVALTVATFCCQSPRMSQGTGYRLHASLGYQLSLTARIQERRLEDGLRDLGLTRIQWCILLAVGNENLRHPSDIAAFIGVDRTATSRALRGMDEDGLIRRKTGAADRRTTAVSLTARGYRLLEAGTPLAKANNALMAARLTDDELAGLKRLLHKVRGGDPADLPRF